MIVGLRPRKVVVDYFVGEMKALDVSTELQMRVEIGLPVTLKPFEDRAVVESNKPAAPGLVG